MFYHDIESFKRRNTKLLEKYKQLKSTKDNTGLNNFFDFTCVIKIHDYIQQDTVLSDEGFAEILGSPNSKNKLYKWPVCKLVQGVNEGKYCITNPSKLYNWRGFSKKIITGSPAISNFYNLTEKDIKEILLRYKVTNNSVINSCVIDNTLNRNVFLLFFGKNSVILYIPDKICVMNLFLKDMHLPCHFRIIGGHNLVSANRCFYGATGYNIDFSLFDTSKLASFQEAFAYSHIKNLDLTKLNMSNIEFMRGLCHNAEFDVLDISNIDKYFTEKSLDPKELLQPLPKQNPDKQRVLHTITDQARIIRNLKLPPNYIDDFGIIRYKR